MEFRAAIVGTGSCTPKRILTNQEMEHIVETSDEWILRRTGIRERRISTRGNGETTTDLAFQAASQALDMAGISSRSLDMILVGTVTPDRQFPSTACMLQHRLDTANIPAMDVSAGCSGFLYALSVANNAIQCGISKTVLVVGVERLSAILNWKDRSTCVLLGDGAGAVVLSATSEPHGILSTHLRSDGSFWNLLYASDGNEDTPEFLHEVDTKPFQLIMEGNRLFKRAVACLTSIAQETLEHNGIPGKEIHLVVPHQANIRIIQAMAENLGISMDKVYTNVHKYGNTSSASIPIALDEAVREGHVRQGHHILLVAFGAGLTWASSLVRWAA